ncbi:MULTISPECIES: AraC family transcriptional regulator [unclassified Bradyrhizobium]|uniref:helix-turn-helix transcriptional regulator n=1 Tax=unclassified Bradyrhizobium TaxID=2631580 RepID=UPI0028F04EDE|nr:MULTISPECIES: AraC family transcriptional regulator [unclassified Bradyrhizobium]
MRDLSYLDRYPLFRSRDSEFVRDRMISVYGVDRFESGDANFGAEANLAQLKTTGLAFCGYDGATSVAFPESTIIRQFFSIRGTARYRLGGVDHAIAAWSPLVCGHSKLDLEFPAGYRQLVLRVEAAPLQRLLQAILGDDGDRALSFEDDDIPDPTVMAFVRQDVFRAADELQKFGQNYSPVAIAEFERSLMIRLLLAHRHNFSNELHVTPPRANRTVVDLVESYIEAHWDEPLDMEKIAAMTHVSVRSIFREFSEAGRGSPGQFVKRVRLRRASELLGTPDEATSVVSVAFRCGFGNLGRFASEYRSAMGELPSETLRKARSRQGHPATDDLDSSAS